jgi:hypothetical protein
MKLRRSNIGISIFLLVVIVYVGYQLFESKMTERPVPKSLTVAEHFKVSDVKLLGQVSTDLLHTSPYYFAFEAKNDDKQILIIVDQYFGRSGKDNPLVEQSYLIVHPQSKNTNQIEVSDGQNKYESTATKQIVSSQGNPSNLVFEVEGKKNINTYDWGLRLLKEY